MQRRTRWITGTAVAGALLTAATLASGASAQTTPAPSMPGAGVCPGYGMMGGFGSGAAASTGTEGWHTATMCVSPPSACRIEMT